MLLLMMRTAQWTGQACLRPGTHFSALEKASSTVDQRQPASQLQSSLSLSFSLLHFLLCIISSTETTAFAMSPISAGGGGGGGSTQRHSLTICHSGHNHWHHHHHCLNTGLESLFQCLPLTAGDLLNKKERKKEKPKTHSTFRETLSLKALPKT